MRLSMLKMTWRERENAYPAALVWSEVEAIDGAVDRLGLKPSDTLIVWTIPPSEPRFGRRRWRR